MGLIRRFEDWIGRKQAGAISYSEAEKALESKLQKEDPGKFAYQSDGFTYQFTDGSEFVPWTEVQQIVTYKVDLLTYDEICLDIYWADWKFTITESTPGWDLFLEKIMTAFPSILENWYGKVTQPPCAYNYTVLFEREGPGA